MPRPCKCGDIANIDAVLGDIDKWGHGPYFCIDHSAWRTHWTADLMKAVHDAVFQCVDRDSGGVYSDELPGVVMAVEDWLEANSLTIVGQLLGERQSAINQRIEAEAKIEAVRELVREWDRAEDFRYMHNYGADVRRALDGPDE